MFLVYLGGGLTHMTQLNVAERGCSAKVSTVIKMRIAYSSNAAEGLDFEVLVKSKP